MKPCEPSWSRLLRNTRMLSSRRAMCRSSSSEHCVLLTSQHFLDSLHIRSSLCIRVSMLVTQDTLGFRIPSLS